MSATSISKLWYASWQEMIAWNHTKTYCIKPYKKLLHNTIHKIISKNKTRNYCITKYKKLLHNTIHQMLLDGIGYLILDKKTLTSKKWHDILMKILRVVGYVLLTLLYYITADLTAVSAFSENSRSKNSNMESSIPQQGEIFLLLESFILICIKSS